MKKTGLLQSEVCHPQRVTVNGEEFTQYEVHTFKEEEEEGDEEEELGNPSSKYSLTRKDRRVVHKRFSDFIRLSRNLQQASLPIPTIAKASPKGRFQEKEIARRMQALTAFLNSLHCHHDERVAQNKDLLEFLFEENRALVYYSYGGMEKLEMVYRCMPKMQFATDVLIKVHAASLNPADLKHRSGELKYLVSRDMPVGIGFDFSGVIVEVGPEVEGLAVGDEVFGDVLGLRTGTVAQYVVCDSFVLAKKPANLSHEEAAGAPLAGLTALQCLEECKMRHSGSVLITGGAGGVGSYAIQIARKLYHASHVATTASVGKKTAFVKKLGADSVYDYHTDYIKRCKEEKVLFDCIIDCTAEAESLVQLVKPGGRLVSILSCATSEMLNNWMELSCGRGASISPLISGSVWLLGSAIDLVTGAMALNRRLESSGGRFKHVITTPTKERMNVLRGLMESGHVVPQVDSEWPLSDAIAAARTLEAGHAQGKIIVRCTDT